MIPEPLYEPRRCKKCNGPRVWIWVQAKHRWCGLCKPCKAELNALSYMRSARNHHHHTYNDDLLCECGRYHEDGRIPGQHLSQYVQPVCPLWEQHVAQKQRKSRTGEVRS